MKSIINISPYISPRGLSSVSLLSLLYLSSHFYFYLFLFFYKKFSLIDNQLFL
nr:MAG TPA: hypothetical protein [Caudoviricetes sp.]